LRSRLFILGALIAAIGVSATVATAAKPGPGTSTGVGSVFVSNPVEDLGLQSLRDQKDSDAAVPAAAYHNVQLTNLDGSGFLRGDWATIVSETGNPAYSPTNTFRYTRSQDEFEQVMGYFWITESQKYIQSLGFGVPGSGLRAVNKEPQRLRINQWGIDNSFATTHKDEIRLGKGGVDDAEDGEVINHEYGHAIHFSQNYAFASVEAGAMSEGFGDYWAVTTTMVVRQRLGLPPLADPACVADWDATSYDPTPPHCLRRVDSNLHYPENLVGQVHADGRIWSRALWDIRNSIGHVRADTVILEGQFDFEGTTMTQLAERIVVAAQRLYGTRTANSVRAAFVARGILS
jgi:zinc metalloprotease ZmpB